MDIKELNDLCVWLGEQGFKATRDVWRLGSISVSVFNKKTVKEVCVRGIKKTKIIKDLDEVKARVFSELDYRTSYRMLLADFANEVRAYMLAEHGVEFQLKADDDTGVHFSLFGHKLFGVYIDADLGHLSDEFTYEFYSTDFDGATIKTPADIVAEARSVFEGRTTGTYIEKDTILHSFYTPYSFLYVMILCKCTAISKTVLAVRETTDDARAQRLLDLERGDQTCAMYSLTCERSIGEVFRVIREANAAKPIPSKQKKAARK